MDQDEALESSSLISQWVCYHKGHVPFASCQKIKIWIQVCKIVSLDAIFSTHRIAILWLHLRHIDYPRLSSCRITVSSITTSTVRPRQKLSNRRDSFIIVLYSPFVKRCEAIARLSCQPAAKRSGTKAAPQADCTHVTPHPCG